MALSLARWGNSLHSGERTYGIVTKRRRWFALSTLLLGIATFFIVADGINPGIDFRGGSEFLVSSPASTDQSLGVDVIVAVLPDATPRVTVLENGEQLRFQFPVVTLDEGSRIKAGLATAYQVPATEISDEVVGPTWGSEVSSKAVEGLVIFLILVTIVMSVYFRAWRMAVAALVALAHDLVFTIGIYAGVGLEVSPASVIGFLTILGYSLYDTVVVFDKVRENTKNVTSQRRFTYAELANLAVNQTLVRSINTSVVALLPVSAILFIGSVVLGAGTLEDISLALFVGMAVGTYSSIFVATPFEVALREREPRIRAHTAEVLRLRESGEMPELRVGALKPGEHQGVAAQPRRKRRP